MSEPEPMKVARYTCGYCATSYATLKEAEDCLARDQEACKAKHLIKDPEREIDDDDHWEHHWEPDIDEEWSPWDYEIDDYEESFDDEEEIINARK